MSIWFNDEQVDSMRNDALESLPPEMIQYGVRLVLRTGSEFVPTLRWRNWDDAAKFAEDEVTGKRATGFWVFKEAAV